MPKELELNVYESLGEEEAFVPESDHIKINDILQWTTI